MLRQHHDVGDEIYRALPRTGEEIRTETKSEFRAAKQMHRASTQ